MSLHSSVYDKKLNHALNIFPYKEPNQAQHKIIQQIIALDEHEQLFLESPTGSGKTIASLTSLLSKMKDDEKLIVFTRTVSQMEPILREWGRIYSYHDVVNDEAPLILPMLGKSRLCKQLPILRKNMINLEVAPQSVHTLCKSLPCKLHPDIDQHDLYQVKSGKMKLRKIDMKITGTAKQRSPPIDDIIDTLLTQPFCGYYGLRSMTKFSTIVVATYPYLRDPLFQILLKSMDVEVTDVHILIDEAHNLVQSSETVITKEELKKVKKIFGSYPVLNKLLKAMNYNRQVSAYEIAPERNYMTLINTISECDQGMRDKLGTNLGVVLQPEVSNVLQFLRARDNGKIYTSSDQLKIIQPTPIHYLEAVKEAKTVVFQSGTFTPLDIYKKLYGFNDAIDIIIKPMRDDQRFQSFLTWKGLTSKYTRRGQIQYNNMARAILNISKISPRHILVVCPSYDYLEAFIPLLRDQNDTERYQYDIEHEQENLDIQKLANKVAWSKNTMILVGVAGGKISEGVEFVKNGNSLLSTVIFCGLPFRPVTRENLFIRNIIASVASNQSVARKLEQQIPIIRLVRQAFGRSIRSDHDKGALIILDYRAERLLKRELGLLQYKKLKDIVVDLHEFFDGYNTLIEL